MKNRVTKSQVKAQVLPKLLPDVIPPKSVVILAQVDARRTPDWVADRGRIFRVGFYNPSDGLDCIWLVNSAGRYEQTVDRKSLLDHFLILKLSAVTDLFGSRARPLKPIGDVKRPSDILAHVTV